eukprot:347775_1
MTTSSKRSFSKFNCENSNTEYDEPPTKKQKMNDSSLVISSKLFSDKSDYSQFETIFVAINNSQLTQQLNVYSGIIKEIAEYSTGTIHYCSNKQCKKDIFVLNKDMEHYYYHGTAEQLGFEYCPKSKSFYCEYCLKFLIIKYCNFSNCEYYQRDWPSNFETCKCTECDSIVYNCYCFDSSINFPNLCNNNKCQNKGEKIIICYNCHHSTGWHGYYKAEPCLKCDELVCLKCSGYYNECERICTKCEQETNQKCGNKNCKKIVNLLCFETFECDYNDGAFVVCCEKCKTVYCEECYMCEFCIGCEKMFCCGDGMFNEDLMEYICEKCIGNTNYTMIKCDQCNNEYKSLYKPKSKAECLKLLNGENEMVPLNKCLKQNCDKYFCVNCRTNKIKKKKTSNNLINMINII